MQLLNMLGWALLNSLWQMSLMWLLYIIIISASGKKLSSGSKHFLSSVFIAFGFIWFIASLFISNLDNEFSRQSITAYQFLSGSSFSFVYSAKKFANIVLPYASLVYLSVLGYLFIRYYRYYVSSQKLKQTGLHKVPAELKIFINELAERIGIHKKVRLWLSSAVQSPMTTGFLKPVILIPLATINHLNTHQMEAVLLHELAHIKRNDYLLNLFITCAEIIFFFNPFALLLIHAIKKERENSCDDLVIQFKYDSCVYASALLSLEKARSKNQKLAMAAVGKSNKMLLHRVMRITGQKNVRTNNIHKLFALLVIASFAALVAFFQPQKITPKLAEHVNTKEINYSIAEPQQMSYINSPVIVKPVAKGEAKSKTSKSKICISKKSSDIDDEAIVSADEPENNDIESADEITEVDATVPRAYSITQSQPAPIVVTPKEYPYVPSSSFSYNETEDNIAHNENDEVKNINAETKKSIRKALNVVKAINWKNIGADAKKLNIIKIQTDLNNYLNEVDCNQIRENITNDLIASENNKKRMLGDLQVQIQTLGEVKVMDLQKAKQLHLDIVKQKQKIQQAELQKQKQLLKQIEELRKKMKIVYI